MENKEIYKTINVEIVGRSELLMNRCDPQSLKSRSRLRLEKYSTKTDAAKAAYIAEIDGKKQLYIPQEAVFSMLINTAKQYRVRRTAVSSILAGTIRIEPEKIPLGTAKYIIDERAVVIQGQRVLKGRAKLHKGWKAKFQIVYDTKHLPTGIESTLREIIEDAGIRMGLLDFRPQHKGWFGTFNVAHFTVDGKEVEVPKLAEEAEEAEEAKETKETTASEETEEETTE